MNNTGKTKGKHKETKRQSLGKHEQSNGKAQESIRRA
jgi:hypothetical protein